MFADLAVLDRDYFSVNEEAIKNIEAELTVVDGKIVYAKGDFSSYSPPQIPVLPDWSPTKSYNGYYNPATHGTSHGTVPHSHNSFKADIKKGITTQVHSCAGSCDVHAHNHDAARLNNVPINNYTAFWGALGCSCFAF